MALRKFLSNRLFKGYRIALPPPAVTLVHLPISSPASQRHEAQQNVAKINFRREFLDVRKTTENEFSRRSLHRRAINPLPEFFSIPVEEKLRESLKSFNITEERINLDDSPAPPVKQSDPNLFGISVQDARKLLRFSLMEKLKLRIKNIPESSIPHFEFLRICAEECGNKDHGVELAKMLDQCGNVIVLGNIVFLRPGQVAKSMQSIITESIGARNDEKREQLESMERQKASIDQRAGAQVRCELYCGLGFLLVQTFGFMRLTFWELSWDVMEPICFFVTSLHFALAYGFFLRTSVEPSFEGYFQRRFKTKQKKLMKIHNFDIHKYNELRKTFHPDWSHEFPHSHYKPIKGQEGTFL